MVVILLVLISSNFLPIALKWISQTPCVGLPKERICTSRFHHKSFQRRPRGKDRIFLPWMKRPDCAAQKKRCVLQLHTASQNGTARFVNLPVNLNCMWQPDRVLSQMGNVENPSLGYVLLVDLFPNCLKSSFSPLLLPHQPALKRNWDQFLPGMANTAIAVGFPL